MPDPDDNDDRDHETDDVGVPDSDPAHLDPGHRMADFFEKNIGDVELGDDTESDNLREFISAAEDGEMEITPDVTAQVRMARAFLGDLDEDTNE